MSTAYEIHPTFDRILQRGDKESMLRQRGISVWMSGLSGSGKTTIAAAVERKLADRGILTQVLDGDNMRTGICNDLGFSEEDRIENIRRIAEVSKLFVNCGIVTINCFVSPTRHIRALAKSIIGADDLVEVYVNTSLEECEKRDVKGLYKKARSGKIKNFTGLDAPYEAPEMPDVDVPTAGRSVEECADQVLAAIIGRIKA